MAGWQGLIREGTELLTGYLASRVDAGELRKDLPLETAATMFVSSLMIFFLTRRHLPEPEWREQSETYARELISVWLEGREDESQPAPTTALRSAFFDRFVDRPLPQEVAVSAPTALNDQTKRVEETTCCIVGGGPAGAMLGLLLARQGVEVTLLEAHRDFERDFRGDTLHASAMEILDEIGLADRLLKLRHAKVRHFTVPTKGGQFTFDLFAGLKTRFPYIVVMAQSRFLEFITEEAERYPNFRLVMGARVKELLEEDGVVRGVSYRGRDGWHEVRATLTVGADGRFSKVRRLAGFEPVKISSPIDVLWFRISRWEGDPKEAPGRPRRERDVPGAHRPLRLLAGGLHHRQGRLQRSARSRSG